MKTKIKRHSRAVISVILAISMLVSCMMVGLIASDAASDNSERLGYGNSFGNISNVRLVGDYFGWTVGTNTSWLEHDSGDMNKWYKDYYLPVSNDGTYGKFHLFLGYASNSGYANAPSNEWWIGYNTTTVCDELYGGNAGNTFSWRVPTSSGSGYFHTNFVFYGKYGSGNDERGRLEVHVEPLDALTETLTPESASITAGETTAITTTTSGGSGSYSHTYTVTGADGNNYNSYFSNGTFAPPVNAKGQVYTITDSVQDSNIAALKQTASTTVTVAAAGPTYYVAGTKELIGSSSSWSVNDANGKMTLSSGTTYTKKFYNVPVGTYEFRITDGSTYLTGSTSTSVSGNANPTLSGNNVTFTTSEAKDVTITFNTAQSSSKYPVTVNLSAPTTWVKTNGSIADISPSSYVDATNNYIVMDSNSSLTGGGKSVTLKHIDNNSSFYWAEITPDNSDLWDNQKWLYWSSTTTSSGIQGNSGTTSKINGTTASDTAVEFKDSQNNYLFKVQKNSSDDKRPLLIYKVSDKVAKIGVRVSNTDGTVNYEFYYQLATPAEEDPDVHVTTVDIYAKDGTLRDGYQKFSEFAQTTITAIKNADGTDNTTALAAVKRYNYQNTGTNTTQAGDTNTGTTRYDYAKATGIPVGSTITVRTRLYQKSQWGDDWYGSNFNNTHYVKAFCVNGVAPEVYTWKGATGSNVYTDYEMTYTITEEDVALDRSNKGYIEITPIIYLKDSTYTKTFYIEGYDRDDERYKTLGWGTTLGIYPYYDGKKESENGFGGYPGQPMLFYKGRYEIQVPLTHDGTSSGAKCLGITLSNNYWDELHRSLDKSIKNNDKGHRQTYDFDDFYKIKEEKNPDQITFSFKLRTNKANNFDDGYDRDNFNYADDTEKTLYRNTNNVLYKSNKTDVFSENGIDEYKDGLNRDINLFGTVLSADQAAQPKLLVVSNGYKYTYVGKYATEWVVYKNDGADAQTGMTKYTYVTQIAPSALVLNSLDSFSAYTGGSSTTAATKPKPLGNYQAAYTKLSGADYVDKAFEICYESSQYINTDDKADRLDGRWLYTKNGDKISATVKIQYKNASNPEWTDEASYTTGYDSKNNKGAVTNAQAYFTNVTPKDLDGSMTAADIPIVPGSYFTFKTVAPTDQDHMNYVFRGWYVSLNGSDPVAVDKVPQLESMLEMTGNAVIIARYEELTSGVLTIRHDIETNDTYKGTGTPYLKVELLNGSNQVKDTYAMTANGQYLTTKYLTTAYASNNYKFRITLKAVGANSDNTYEDTTESGSLNTMSMAPTSGTVNSNDGKYFTVPISSLFTDGTLTVKSLVYKTHFNLAEYNYKYVINYKFPTRLYGDEVYKVESGNISGNKMSAYFDGTKESAKVKKNIISGNTPFESNFMKKMNWDYDTAYSGTISSATDYAKGGQIVTPTTSGTSTTYTVYVTVIADDNTELNVNAFFMLPYQYNETTKAAISYDVYNGKNTYDSSKDRGSGSDKYELYFNGVREFNDLTDEQLKAQTSPNRKYLMYDESAAENSPRRVFDNLEPLTSASKTTQNGEDKIVGYDNTVSGFTLSAPMGTLITYDGVKNLGKKSHFVRAPEYIYVADGDTKQKDSWQHLSYGNVDYHTIRETTTFRTHDVTTNAQYVSYNNVKDGIVANEGYTKKYFSRWDIYSQSDSRYVASCYYYDFNYTSYEDIYVVPVYESSKPSAFIDEALDKNNMATVSFLDTTRNQWNVKVDSSAPNEVADKLYTDFALSFGDGSTILSELKSTDTKKVRVGMLIERLDGLTGADTTKFATDTDSNVITAASSYVKAFDNNAKKAIANMLINDEGANSATYKSTEAALYGNAANCKIASNDDWTTRDLTALDNKNRIEYYYGINKLLDSNQYKNYKYAYRAISYILVNEGSGWSAKISDPAYFTIYDTATQTVAG